MYLREGGRSTGRRCCKKQIFEREPSVYVKLEKVCPKIPKKEKEKYPKEKCPVPRELTRVPQVYTRLRQNCSTICVVD